MEAKRDDRTHMNIDMARVLELVQTVATSSSSSFCGPVR
jgi:hypothetical protein